MKGSAHDRARRRNAKRARFRAADLPAKIRLATPIARRILLEGHVDLEAPDTDLDEGIVTRVEELIGIDGPACPDDQTPALVDALFAAYVLGLSLGLLMRPEVFAGGKR